MKLHEIFTVPPVDNIINKVIKSPQSDFYNKMMTDMKPKGEVEGGDEPPAVIQEIVKKLCADLHEDSILMELGGSFYQRRCGYLKDHFKNYFPVSLSEMNMIRYSSKFQRISVAADAADLPIIDSSVDAVFTHTFLEHPEHLEAVIGEIFRTVKPGGRIVHCDAWHCRWWQRYGIVGVEKWKNITFTEKFIVVAAKLTEFQLLRKSIIVLRRIWREIFNPISLKYKKLQPNYTLDLARDEDAVNSIDPIDLLRFYEKHGFRHDPPLTLIERILFKERYIYLVREI